MKRKLFLMALAALPFMLAACGDKQANPAQTAGETQTEAQSADSIDADEDDSPVLQTGQVDEIRKVWETKPLTGVAANGKVDIERFAYVFCREYSNYEPNKVLYDYLTAPEKYENENFNIESKLKNGFISCRGLYQVGFDTTGCYWKRKNGHSLVAFVMEQGHESNPDLADILVVFYDYDPATDTMTPEPALSKKIAEGMAQYDEYSVVLPEQGKDIELIGHKIDYVEHDCENICYLFRWDGNDFKLEKKPS